MEPIVEQSQNTVNMEQHESVEPERQFVKRRKITKPKTQKQMEAFKKAQAALAEKRAQKKVQKTQSKPVTKTKTVTEAPLTQPMSQANLENENQYQVSLQAFKKMIDDKFAEFQPITQSPTPTPRKTVKRTKRAPKKVYIESEEEYSDNSSYHSSEYEEIVRVKPKRQKKAKISYRKAPEPVNQSQISYPDLSEMMFR